MNRVKALLLSVTVLATTALAQGWTIEPGKGVGPLALNASPAQIAAQLTPTEYIGSQQNPAFVRYGGDEALVQYASNKAVMITLNKPTLKTKSGPVKWTPYSGAGVGVAWTSVEPSLGRNYVARDLKVAKSQPRETYYAYSSKGLGFRVKAGLIVQVDVWPAK